ncbi:hypothetical protein [Actinophytocola sediminis]
MLVLVRRGIDEEKTVAKEGKQLFAEKIGAPNPCGLRLPGDEVDS